MERMSVLAEQEGLLEMAARLKEQAEIEEGVLEE